MRVAILITLVGVAAQMAAVGYAQPVLFTASPTSGTAPLTVEFCSAAGIGLDFGDGTSSGLGTAPAGACPAGFGRYISHIYTAPGTFQLHGLPCPSSKLHPECGQAAGQASALVVTVSAAQR